MRTIIFVKNINNSFDGIETPLLSDITGEIKPIGKIPTIHQSKLMIGNKFGYQGIKIPIKLLANKWLINNIVLPDNDDIVDGTIYYDSEGNIIEVQGSNIDIGDQGVFDKEDMFSRISKYSLLVLLHDESVTINDSNYKDYIEYIGFVDVLQTGIKNGQISIQTLSINEFVFNVLKSITKTLHLNTVYPQIEFNTSNGEAVNVINSSNKIMEIINSFNKIININLTFNQDELIQILHDSNLHSTVEDISYNDYYEVISPIRNNSPEGSYNVKFFGSCKFLWFGYEDMVTMGYGDHGYVYQLMAVDTNGNWDNSKLNNVKTFRIDYWNTLGSSKTMKLSIVPYVMVVYDRSSDSEIPNHSVKLTIKIKYEFHYGIDSVGRLNKTILDVTYSGDEYIDSSDLGEILVRHGIISNKSKEMVWQYLSSLISDEKDIINEFFSNEFSYFQLEHINSFVDNDTGNTKYWESNVTKKHEFQMDIYDFAGKQYSFDKYGTIIYSSAEDMTLIDIFKTILEANQLLFNINNNFQIEFQKAAYITNLHSVAVDFNNIFDLSFGKLLFLDKERYVDYMYTDKSNLWNNTRKFIGNGALTTLSKNALSKISFKIKMTWNAYEQIKAGYFLYMFLNNTDYMYGLIISVVRINNEIFEIECLINREDIDYWRTYAKELFNLG